MATAIRRWQVPRWGDQGVWTVSEGRRGGEILGEVGGSSYTRAGMIAELVPRRLLVVTEMLAEVWDELALPSGFEVRRLVDWRDGVAEARRVPYDVIVTTYPLGQAPFQEVLDAIRSPGSASGGAGLVAVAAANRIGEAAAFLGRGLSRVVAGDDDGGALAEALHELASVSPRARARLLVTLALPVGGRECRIRTFTENISATGMLLGTSNRLEIGQRVGFELRAPDSAQAIRGSAEVVRHTLQGRERISGIGLRFLRLEDGSQQALTDLVRARLD